MNEDQIREDARRGAICHIMEACMRSLDYEDVKHASWILERELAISALRDVCTLIGDNDWDQSLHIYDIIDKHLTRHLHRLLNNPTALAAHLDELTDRKWSYK